MPFYYLCRSKGRVGFHAIPWGRSPPSEAHNNGGQNFQEDDTCSPNLLLDCMLACQLACGIPCSRTWRSTCDMAPAKGGINDLGAL